MTKQNQILRAIRILTLPIMLLAMVLSGCLLSQPASAADKPAYRLQISPTQDDVGTIIPGKKYTGTFYVQNTGTKAYGYNITIAPYNVSGQYYAQDLDTVTGYNEIMDWITIDEGQTGTVEPNTQQEVSFTISVPKDAPAGLQSAAMIATMDSNSLEDVSSIQTVSRVAYYFYANVDGETRKTGEIVSNKVPQFFFNPPIVTNSVVKNTGNIYTTARYELEVYDILDGKLAYTNVTEDKNGDKVYETKIIFPDTERYNEVSWEGAPQLGIFKVKQKITIFDEVSETEKIVFLCPLWFLFIVILFVGVAVFWVVSRILDRKREK